jgi:hypothetical protein
MKFFILHQYPSCNFFSFIFSSLDRFSSISGLFQIFAYLDFTV